MKAEDDKPGVSFAWFNMLYQVVLGQENPRFCSFMIDGALARSA